MYNCKLQLMGILTCASINVTGMFQIFKSGNVCIGWNHKTIGSWQMANENFNASKNEN